MRKKVFEIKLGVRRRGRPSKDFGERHCMRLIIKGTVDEVNYIREQAKLSGKSLSRYIIESVI